MGGQISLSAVYIADIMGILVSGLMFFGNRRLLNGNDREGRYVKIMLITTIIACATDSLAFMMDGKPGMLAFVCVYMGALWMFISNLIIGAVWLVLVLEHIAGNVSKLHRIIINALNIFALLVLMFNIFYPLVFEVNDNSYSRGPLFFIYVVIELIYIADSIILYIKIRFGSGLFKFFNVLLFVGPVIIGTVIQLSTYGLSTISPCIAVAIAGIICGLQNEYAYKDPLTGSYNRYYLETIRKEFAGKNSGYLAAMMLDMNQFKLINDNFGHNAGDEALSVVANICKEAVQPSGIVIRYAGDEFILILDTQDEAFVKDCMKSIEDKFAEFNELNENQYKLSAAIGYGMLDFKSKSIDDLLNKIDKEMYDAKAAYYNREGIDRRRRRD